MKITQETFNQVARYNIKFRAPLIIVTNGLSHYCAKYDANSSKYTFLKDIPQYGDLIGGRQG